MLVEPVLIVVCLLGGLFAGALIGWFAMKAKVGPELGEAGHVRERAAALETEVRSRDQEILRLATEATDARARLAAAEVQREEFEKRVNDVFSSAAGRALDRNSEKFQELAQQHFKLLRSEANSDLEKRQQAIQELVKPIDEKLKSFDENIKNIEKDRVGAYEQLKEQVKGLSETQTRLQVETNNLVRALRNPQQRGKWGEIQLETILKMAGLEEGVHFRRQEHRGGEDGSVRPDTVVFLPTGREIVIDSKAPLDAYLDAQDMPDEELRGLKLKEHAKCVRGHIQALTKKAYWDRFETADFVIMFLPGESIFSAAVQQDASLLEFGVENRVFIASPMTLITMLRSVAMGWRQERLAENAKKISDEAKELYGRFGILGKHFGRVGKQLDGAVSAYNDAVGSLDTRVLPQVRRLKELKVASEDLPVIEPVERKTREFQSVELRQLPGTLLAEEEPVTQESAALDCPVEADSNGVVTLAAAMVDE